MLRNCKEASSGRHFVVMCADRHPAPTLTVQGILPSAVRYKCQSRHFFHVQSLTRHLDLERALRQTVPRCVRSSASAHIDRRLLLEACTLHMLTANCGQAMGAVQSPSFGSTGAGPSDPVGGGIESLRQAYDTYAGDC